jgi:membrane fusion protein, epimerase transport system
MSDNLSKNTTTVEPMNPSTNTGMGISGPVLTGVALIVIFIGIFGSWAALAPLNSAALAPGVIRVESNRKTVQHLEGGIIEKIHVREGDRVKAGQMVVTLTETRSKATLGLLLSRYHAASAQQARLASERDGKRTIVFPKELTDSATDADTRAIIDGQKSIFIARRNSLEGQTAIMGQRISQAREEIQGLKGQIKSENHQLKLISEEISGVKQLFDKGLARKPRLLALQRRQSEIEGSISKNRARMAQIRQAILESQLQIKELQTKALNETLQRLREVQEQLADIKEQRRAAEDVLKRATIRAPLDGTIVGLQVHTTGGVVAPGAPILDIIPSDELLVIDAQIDPKDIDIIRVGLPAQVRLTAFNQRNVPPVEGVVTSVSADRFTDQNTGGSYFKAQVNLKESAREALQGRTLISGMQADVMIVTGERTALDYLIAPLVRSFDRSFREK